MTRGGGETIALALVRDEYDLRVSKTEKVKDNNINEGSRCKGGLRVLPREGDNHMGHPNAGCQPES